MSVHFARDGINFSMPGLSRPEAGVSGHRSGLAAWFAGAMQWLAERPRRRAVIDQLSVMSDHELADIGLTRHDVTRVFDPVFAARRGSARHSVN
jgi:uncharacterized protein YjiS (DUF1127 family)